MSTTTDLTTLKINYLTQAQYDTAVEGGTINADEIYMTPADASEIADVLYPVGSYYETSDSSFDPNTAWGGTWSSETITDDYIVEEGTSDGWKYRKYNSGISECWLYETNSNLAMTTQEGNGYYAAINRYNPPTNLFATSLDSVVATAECNSGLVSVVIAASGKTQLGVYHFCTQSLTATVYTHIFARGLWKTFVTPTTTYRWHRTA